MIPIPNQYIYYSLVSVFVKDTYGYAMLCMESGGNIELFTSQNVSISLFFFIILFRFAWISSFIYIKRISATNVCCFSVSYINIHGPAITLCFNSRTFSFHIDDGNGQTPIFYWLTHLKFSGQFRILASRSYILPFFFCCFIYWIIQIVHMFSIFI